MLRHIICWSSCWIFVLKTLKSYKTIWFIQQNHCLCQGRKVESKDLDFNIDKCCYLFFSIIQPICEDQVWAISCQKHVNMHYYNSWFFLVGFSSQNTQNDKHKKKSLYQYGQINLDLLAWLGSQFGPFHFN
jgi:hypothetical protein